MRNINYVDYYKSCLYKENPIDIEKFTYKVLPYQINIDGIKDTLFKDANKIKPDNWIIKIPYNNNFLPYVQQVVNQVKEELDTIFCSNYFVENASIYRTVYSNNITTSAIYHYDNFPPTMLKCMVYLDDVLSDEDGPIELCDKIYPPTRSGFDNWRPAPNNSRLSDDELKNVNKTKIFGKAGTTIIFYPNCIHRASLPGLNKTRDVLNLGVRPTDNKDDLFKYIKGFEAPGSPFIDPRTRYKK